MKGKLASFAFLALILSMVIAPQYSYGQSQADSLIEIATKARDQIQIQLSEIDSLSKDLETKFNLGVSEIELIKEAADREDLSAARQHFLSAMKIFQEISQIISNQSTQDKALAATQSTTTRSNELERLELYVDRIRDIANKNKVDINFSKVEELIDSAKTAFGEGDIDKANSLLGEIKREIIQLNNSLKEKTRTTTTERAKSFAGKYLQELDSLIAQAKEIGVSEKTIERLYQAKENLDEAADVERIIQEVKQIIKVKEDFESTKAQRIKSRINQLESKLDYLSKTADSTNPDLKEAKIMVSKLMDLVSTGKLNEAISMITSLSALLNDIENSMEKQTIESGTVEQSATSLSDSKMERIKIKIQRLENQLNQLSEQIDENTAVKRWLDSGFDLLDNAKSHIDDSPEEVLELISDIEKIIKRIENTIR